MRASIQTLCLLLVMSLLFASCSDSTSDSGKDGELQAVITFTPDEPEVGNQVVLSSTSSLDTENMGYDINWTLSTKPSGSNSTIAEPTLATTAFIPDVAGDYEVKLEISNSSEKKSSSKTTVISVINPAPKAVELSGRISEDSTLVNIFTDPTLADYIVVGNLDVNAMLTINPGVVIHVKDDLGININDTGIIKAEGTADSLIVFTGEKQSTNGTWRGINVLSNSVDNIISYAEINYGGSKSAATYFDATALMIDRAKINLSNVLISHSGGYGIQTRRDESEFPMTNMQFEQNTKDHAYIHTSQMKYFDTGSTFDGGFVTVYSGGTTSDMDISVLDGAKYKIENPISFSHNIVIDAGAQFEFATDAKLDIKDGSSIIAKGTTENRIVFTGTSKSPGAWDGIFVSSSSVDNIFEHVDISYGGGSNIATYFNKTNMAIDNAKIKLIDVSITNSAGYGIETRRGGSTFSIVNSTFENNSNSDMKIHVEQASYVDNLTDFNGGDVEIYGGSTPNSGAETWSKLKNGTYFFSSSATIANEITIEEGTNFEMGTDVILSIAGSSSNSNGVIKAVGSENNLITFSGRSKAPGAWGGIVITSSSVENIMDHVRIEYGGGIKLITYLDAANLGIHNNGKLTLKNSFIENSAKYGIIVRASHNAVLIIETETVSYSNNANDNILYMN